MFFFKWVVKLLTSFFVICRCEYSAFVPNMPYNSPAMVGLFIGRGGEHIKASNLLHGADEALVTHVFGSHFKNMFTTFTAKRTWAESVNTHTVCHFEKSQDLRFEVCFVTE